MATKGSKDATVNKGKSTLPHRPKNKEVQEMGDSPSYVAQAAAVLDGTAKSFQAVDPALDAVDKAQLEGKTGDPLMDARAKKVPIPAAPKDPLAALGVNSTRRLRGGTSTGARPMLKRLLGTPKSDGTFPEFSVAELCKATGKSEVNVRTILSDLRSPVYCGKEGLFPTVSRKNEAGVVVYKYAPVEEKVDCQPD